MNEHDRTAREVNTNSMNFWFGKIDAKLTNIMEAQIEAKEVFEKHELRDMARFTTIDKLLMGINRHRWIFYGILITLSMVVGWHIEYTGK